MMPVKILVTEPTGNRVSVVTGAWVSRLLTPAVKG